MLLIIRGFTSIYHPLPCPLRSLTLYNTYRTEADQQKVTLQKMKDDGIKDEYDIRKMNEVLQE